LTQAESGSTQLDRGDIPYQCVARGTANTLPDPIEKASSHYDADAGCEREQRLCQGGEPVTGEDERLPLAYPIADCTCE
jgi:hypothetical protein